MDILIVCFIYTIHAMVTEISELNWGPNSHCHGLSVASQITSLF
jgi:hypothetical protein